MILVLLACTPPKVAPPPAAETELAPPELTAKLESIRAAAGLPAVGLAVVEGGEVSALAVVGTRRWGTDDPVTVEDGWHLGSDTKAMTAMLFARVVESGKLGWETTLAEAFPDVEVHPELASVTLAQLVSHQGGMPADLLALPDLWRTLWEKGDPVEQRATFARDLLARAPETTPGGGMVYSNAGYMLLGAAMERAMGSSWEQLMNDLVFSPLSMTDCGFGPPARSRPGPWGHRAGPDGSLQAVPPTEPGADNPPALGPAGTVYCPLRSWARFVTAQLSEGSGLSLLEPESWRRLHQPEPGQEYAGGWGVVERAWAQGPILTHSGSNSMFFAVAWLAPDRHAAWLAVTNAGPERAAAPLDQLIGELVMGP